MPSSAAVEPVARDGVAGDDRDVEQLTRSGARAKPRTAWPSRSQPRGDHAIPRSR